MNEQPTPSKKPFIYYAMIAAVILMLLNVFVFPMLMSPRVTQVSYDQFLEKLQAGGVKAVELQEDNRQLFFVAADEEGKERVYSTGVFPDEKLSERLTEAGVQFSAVIPQENGSLLNFLLTWILPTAIMVLPMVLFWRMMKKRMDGSDMMSFGMGKSNAKMYVAAQTGKTFADVAGQDEAKEALEEIVDFLHNPDKYRSVGAVMPKGVLLVGPPGTGKTLLAKAVAGEAGVPFFSIAGSEFVEMFVGQGAARVRDLFKQAKEKSPCIVFIDEIDTIGKKRDGGGFVGGNDEREQTLNQLLSEMDGFDGSSGVVILAATNRPETLDKALLRPGRFDRRVPVELPDLAGREAILRVHAKDVMMDDNIDFKAVARATSGASGAELANLINEAALRAVKCGRRMVTQTDLTESVDVVVAGYQRKNAVLTTREKEIVAYHEIGHALVAAKQSHSAPVTKITIVPRTSGALGYTMQTPESDTVLLSKEEALAKIATLTGGRSAEEIIFGSVTSGASNDIEQATKLARSMVTRLGMSKSFDMTALETVTNQYLGGDATLACSAETAAAVDREVVEIIRAAHEKALDILKSDMPHLHALAKYLLEKETITGEEFMDILKKPAPESTGPAVEETPSAAGVAAASKN